MKKVIFSAIAMIAFVGSSMAADIAIEDELADSSKIEVCVAQAMAYLDENCLYDSMTDKQLLAVFNREFDKCYGTNTINQSVN
jgi:F420-dependent methylenetetrahydromethanopterin dehydrogenase